MPFGTKDPKVHISTSEYSEMTMSLGSLSNADGTLKKKAVGQMSLQQCARNGDVDTLRRLLEESQVRQHVDDLDGSGLSALHYSARCNQFEAVRVLVEQGEAKITIRDEEGATPLHYAARKKPKEDRIEDATNVVEYLSARCDVNIRDNYQSTPLHFAAIKGNSSAAKVLLKNEKILVNAKDWLRCTPLHDAATNNQVSVATRLIKAGAGLFYEDQEKCTALHLAAAEGFVNFAKLMIQTCEEDRVSQLINCKDKDDNTALHFAIEARSFPLVKLLVKYGADVNKRCRLKASASTPIHLAAIAGETEIVELLVENGAKVDAHDRDMATPLHRAAEFQHVEVVKFLLRNVDTSIDMGDEEGYTPLLTAVSYGNTNIIKSLIDENVDITAIESQERNAFHLAVANDQPEALKVLLKAVRDTEFHRIINDDDRYGNTPLHLAAESGSLGSVKRLLKAGADLSIKNENEETPFILACKNGKMGVVSELLKRSGTVLNDEDEYSNTGLHVACAEGHTAIAILLCEEGADKLARNHRSRAPIDLAAERGYPDIIDYLIKEDVSPNPMDKEKQLTPLHLASREGHENVVQTLLNNGADLSMKDPEGNNCLDIAIDCGHRHVVTALLKSPSWYQALCNEKSLLRETPLRKLIRKMPELAPLALNRMICFGPENMSRQDPDGYVEFNYEFVDDTYTDYNFLNPEHSHWSEDYVGENGSFSDDNLPPKGRQPYTDDLMWVWENHPLCIMVEEKQEALLAHPLCLALIRHKWSMAKTFFFSYLIFYIFFISMVTAYMVTAQAPWTLNDTLCTVENVQKSSFEEAAMWMIWICVLIGIVIEGFQIAATKWLYFEPINILDWFCYITAAIIVIDLTDCQMRTEWQWELGAFTVLAVWMDMLLSFRRLPALGLYVVMIVDIFMTFAKFFIIFFLFIVAFALSFYILLQNQDSFADVWPSIIKTWVMMLGELEFSDIFYGDEEAIYPVSTYIIFTIFLVIVAIIIMNLLVGLAVDDVYALREQAKLVKLRMQIELALDIETALPEYWIRKLQCNTVWERYYPNREVGAWERFSTKTQRMLEGPLLDPNAILRKVVDTEGSSSVPEVIEVEQRLTKHINNNSEQMRDLNLKMRNIEMLLKRMAGDKISVLEESDS